MMFRQVYQHTADKLQVRASSLEPIFTNSLSINVGKRLPAHLMQPLLHPPGLVEAAELCFSLSVVLKRRNNSLSPAQHVCPGVSLQNSIPEYQRVLLPRVVSFKW